MPAAEAVALLAYPSLYSDTVRASACGSMPIRSASSTMVSAAVTRPRSKARWKSSVLGARTERSITFWSKIWKPRAPAWPMLALPIALYDFDSSTKRSPVLLTTIPPR